MSLPSNSPAQAQIGPNEFLQKVEEEVRNGRPLGIVVVMAETLESLGYGPGIDRARSCLTSLWPKDEATGT